MNSETDSDEIKLSAPATTSNIIEEPILEPEREKESEKNLEEDKKQDLEPELEQESLDIQFTALKSSIKNNIPFYLVLLGCLYYFTINTNSSNSFNKRTFFNLLISFIVMSFLGVIIHYISHKITITNIYEQFKLEKGNMLTRNKTLDKIFKAGCRLFDFHSTTHHDSHINKAPINIFYEFINNACTQGLLLLLTKTILNFLDSRIIVLWAFLYATLHNINYLYIKPITHAQHHIKEITNYGIDIWDIILNTKYDWTHIESHNHYAINIIILSGLIVKYLNKI